jgi:3(or 17)beta-hydroxysteroid dehydrogenase
MAQLSGKVALVAGGTGGIGEAIARKLADEGARVFLGGRNPEKTAPMAAAIGAVPVQLDVCSAADWQQAVSGIETKEGRLDILVNAQGETLLTAFEEATLDQFRYMLSLNAESVFLGAQAALPLMRKSGAGSIINIGSIIHARPDSTLAGYGASKAAMTALSKSLALHCAQTGSGIRVNVIHPGGILTPMLDRAINDMDVPYDEGRAMWEATHPLGRFGMPEEIASAALYFASDLSGFTTGTELYIDGGAAIRP